MKYVVGYISSQYIVEICCVKLFMAFLLFEMFALKLILFPCLCACILKMKRLTNIVYVYDFDKMSLHRMVMKI